MRIVFMGTPEFSLNILQALIDSEHTVVGVVTQPDKRVGRKQLITQTPIKELAIKAGIPVFQPEKIRVDYQQVLDWKPDLIVTAAYGQIIPAVLLDLPVYGAINVHASLLPRYRGGAPIQWAIMNGEETTGITVMYMSEKMDAGDIIKQDSIAIEATDDVGTLHQKLSVLGASLLLETLPSIESKTNTRQEQDLNLVTYAPNISKDDEKIDWTKDADVIFNQIRAMNPWPGAYTVISGIRFKIFKAEEVVRIHNIGPGEIIRIYTDAMLVTTGEETCIKIIEGQLEGRKRQHMKDILNGNHPFELEKTFE